MSTENKDLSGTPKDDTAITLPPWPTPALWEEINQAIAVHLGLHHDRLKRLQAHARLIQKDFLRIYPLMEALCAETCPTCRHPCCRTAKPYYDFRDLIYLHLCGLKPPYAQPIGRIEETCRYLRADGCGLARKTRPWICIWYLCPAQTTLLQCDGGKEGRIIQHALVRIKKARKALEDNFINQVAEGIGSVWNGA